MRYDICTWVLFNSNGTVAAKTSLNRGERYRNRIIYRGNTRIRELNYQIITIKYD